MPHVRTAPSLSGGEKERKMGWFLWPATEVSQSEFSSTGTHVGNSRVGESLKKEHPLRAADISDY